ncbi:MAG TPA: hypothetical protein PLS55_14515, partial [Thermogutta sp.]|nr:hypothetical protein [Thermogutta sp.]
SSPSQRGPLAELLILPCWFRGAGDLSTANCAIEKWLRGEEAPPLSKAMAFFLNPSSCRDIPEDGSVPF